MEWIRLCLGSIFFLFPRLTHLHTEMGKEALIELHAFEIVFCVWCDYMTHFSHMAPPLNWPFHLELLIVDGHRQLHIKHNKLIARLNDCHIPIQSTWRKWTTTINGCRNSNGEERITVIRSGECDTLELTRFIIWIMLLLLEEKTIWGQSFSKKKLNNPFIGL